MRLPGSFALPDFPWDTLRELAAVARAYPGGAVDLTIGSPVDPVHKDVAVALGEAGARGHAYPPAVGSVQVRSAIVSFMSVFRGCSVLDSDDVVLTVGSKELVASLAFQLGLGSGDAVGFPEVAYPTYEVGAVLAGATTLRLPKDPAAWPGGGGATDTGGQADAVQTSVEKTSPVPKLVWINSPGNPDGHVYDVTELRTIVAWARQVGAIVVADECYALLDWEGAPRGSAAGTPSLLDDAVTDGNLDGLLVVHSLSKQANLAGYRAAWVCGDSELVAGLRELRKHWGLMVPGPVQAALEVALRDKDTVVVQREVYRQRRERLLAACAAAGLVNDSDSVAGLYLWVRDVRMRREQGISRAENTGGGDLVAGETRGRALVRRLAQVGILAAPGEFYGEAGNDWVRLSLTAADSDIARACERLALL